MRIVVNADDLGMSPAVNQAIFDRLARGSLTSATLLMNAPGIDDALGGVRDYARASFGIHLNLSEFEPLTRSPLLVALQRDPGEQLARRLGARLPAELAAAIETEWCAQIDRALAHGVEPSHLDGHHHVHTRPGVFLVLKAVQRRYGIRRVRISRNLFGPHETPSWKLLASKAAWNIALRNALYRTRTTERFGSFQSFIDRLPAGLPAARSIELMCHPGNPGFVGETAALDSDWRDHLPPQARLVSYRDV